MKEVVRIFKLNLGENHPDYGTAVNNLAQLYGDMGRYEEAMPLMKEAMRTTKEILGDNHPDYGIRLNNLATLYYEMGRYEDAEPLMKEAMRIDKESLGENHSSYANDINNLAQVYQAIGKYDIVESLMKEALKISKETLGENHPNYSRSLNNLALFYKDMGRFEESEPLMNESMKVIKTSIGENNPEYATDLNNLAILYFAMGRYKQAEPLLKEAIKIDKAILGENHPNYSRDLNNLAMIYLNMNQYELTELLMKEVIRIYKISLGTNHPSYGNSINNLAQLYQKMGRYTEALTSMKEATQITKESLGVDHLDYGIRLSNLAVLYQKMGEDMEALTMIKEAMPVLKKNIGENHPDYGTLINNLTSIYQNMGRNDLAEPFFLEAFEIQKNQIKNNTGYLSEKEMEEFVDLFLDYLEIYQSFNKIYVKEHPPTGAFAFDIELYRKGILLKSARSVRTRILESGDTALISNFNQLILLRKHIEESYSNKTNGSNDDQSKLEQKGNELEKNLVMRSQDYRQAIKEMDFTWKDVQKQLQPDEAVLEFASFISYSDQWVDSTYYCAIILRKNYEYPQMINLFEEKELNSLLSLASASEEDILRTYYTKHEESKAKKLYKQIWEPIDRYLDGVRKIDFAVSGQLNRVAFHALTDTTGNLLLNKYDLVQLNSTREIALQKTDKHLESIAVFGGIDYNCHTTDMLAFSGEVHSEKLPRSVYRSDSTNRNLNLNYLHGTMEEAKEVGDECRDKGMKVSVYSGKNATEEQFRFLGNKKSPDIIHIATHGFYFPEEKQRNKEERMRFIQLGQQENQFVYSPDPLIRSGLAMAGANHVWQGEKIPEGVEDGILTARDVSQMNLMNTELVVLSACQTGLGDVKGSEGVYGLQRAFKMTGTRYIMMSLWKVPDETTKEFMVSFYGNLSSGMTIRDSYRNTQKEMNAKYPDDPFKWAAFVLVE